MRMTMRVLALLALEACVLLVTACVAVAKLEHVPTSTPLPSDRTDCGEILGTAFRSDSEQAWFVDNCSAWRDTTLGEVPVAPRLEEPTPAPSPDRREEPAGTPSPTASVTATPSPSQTASPAQTPAATPTQQRQLEGEERCAALRGRPYESNEDRQWYRQNCLGGTPTALAESRDCDEIRGRPYASEAQRRWYLENCGGSQASGQGQGGGSQGQSSFVGPDGRPCSAIYGTRYLSRAERDWFEANCPH